MMTSYFYSNSDVIMSVFLKKNSAKFEKTQFPAKVFVGSCPTKAEFRSLVYRVIWIQKYSSIGTSDVTVALKQCRQKCKCWAWGPEATEEHLCSWRHCFKVTVMTWWCHYYYETMTSGTQMFPSRLGPWGDWGTFVSLTSLFHGNRGIRDLAKGSKLYDLKRHHNMAGYKTQIRSYIT